MLPTLDRIIYPFHRDLISFITACVCINNNKLQPLLLLLEIIFFQDSVWSHKCFPGPVSSSRLKIGIRSLLPQQFLLCDSNTLVLEYDLIPYLNFTILLHVKTQKSQPEHSVPSLCSLVSHTPCQKLYCSCTFLQSWGTSEITLLLNNCFLFCITFLSDITFNSLNQDMHLNSRMSYF